MPWGNTVHIFRIVIENELGVDDSEMATSLFGWYFLAFTGDCFNTAVTTAVIVKFRKKPSAHKEAPFRSIQ